MSFQALLLDSVRESIVASDPSFHVTFWNKGAELLFGYSAEEAIGAPLDSLILPHTNEARVQWEAELKGLREHGRWQGQTQRCRKDGVSLWLDIVASSITDPDGQPSGVVAMHRDVTELRRSQLQLKNSEQRLRNLASRLMVVREHERSALARELHDELGQSLTRLNIDLQWLLSRQPRYLQTQRTKAMPSLVDNILNTVQHISSQLRPAILDDLGLEAAIEWQGKSFAEWNNCRCRLHLKIGHLKANLDRDIAVFRILQEALTNVARHARAKIVVIRARITKGELVLEIRDNGIGVADGRLTSAQSLGLFGMRERAEAVGGCLQIQSLPTGGTIVRLRVPLNTAQPAVN